MLVSFSPDTWYRIQNDHLGPSFALDVVNDNGESSSGKLQMAPIGNYSGQFWQIRPHPTGDGTYTLCSWFLGPTKQLSTISPQYFYPQIPTPLLTSFPSTRWRILPWADRQPNGLLQASGTYKLVAVSEGEGREMCLDTFWAGKNELFLGEGLGSGKHWRITPLENIDGRAKEFLTGL